MKISTVLLALTLIAIVGCGGENEPIVSPTVEPQLESPPMESGIVTRGGVPFAIYFVDATRGLGAVIGADTDEFCNGIVDFDVVAFQDVSIPNHADRIVEILLAEDLTASVWPFLGFNCGRFTTEDPVGVGTVGLTSTDNDLLAFVHDLVNHNAWGWMLRGKIVSPNGTQYPVSITQRNLWDGADPASSQSIAHINVGGL